MKKKILIVDDNMEARLLLETILINSGYTAISAVNGAEAMEKLRLYRLLHLHEQRRLICQSTVSLRARYSGDHRRIRTI